MGVNLQDYQSRKMKNIISASIFLALISLLNGALAIGGAMQGLEDAMDIQREQIDRLRDFLGPVPVPTSSTATKRQSPITFSNPAAEQFFVDGTTIPDGV